MSPRIKTPVQPNIATVEDYQKVVDQIGLRATQIAKLQADRDAEIAAINERYSNPIKEKEALNKADLKDCRDFADSNYTRLFGKKRSATTASETEHGFRKGMPSLKRLKGWTAKLTLNAINRLGLRNECVNVKVTENKDGMLALSKKEGGHGKLKEIGYEVVQSETYFIKSKTEPKP